MANPWPPPRRRDRRRKRIILNMARCRGCLTLLVSLSRHSFVSCPCPKECFVDGGTDYLRRGAKNFDDLEELSVFEWHGKFYGGGKP